MTHADVLVLLKIDLQISASAYDDYLASLIDASAEYIKTEGITLNLDRSGDVDLLRMYAAYLYRQRSEPDMQMPRALRYNLNNRLLSEKAAIR